MRKEIENIADGLKLKISYSTNIIKVSDFSFKITIRYIDNKAYYFVTKNFGMLSVFFSSSKIKVLINQLEILFKKHQINLQKLHINNII